MNQPLTVALFSLLQTQGFVSEPEERKDWPCFISNLPEQPNNAVCLYDTTPIPDGRISRTGDRVEHPQVQIRVRALDYVTSRTKIEEIDKYLRTIWNKRFDVGNYIYDLTSVSAGGVLALGLEQQTQKRRHIHTLNISASIIEDNVNAAVDAFHQAVHVTMPANMN